MIAFVAKSPKGTASWKEFGSTREEFEKWRPHICGICCIKMVGDTYNLTTGRSLYSLTMECFQKKGFVVDENGNISGVYHYPLLELAKEYGMKGSVEKNLNIDRIQKGLQKNGIIILSISLKQYGKVGSHLIVVHKHDSSNDEFVIHDCAFLLGDSGENVVLNKKKLDSISNNKGLILYSPEIWLV